MATYYDKVTALAPKVWFKFNETSGTPTNSGSDTCTLTVIGTGNSPSLNQSGVINKSVKFDNGQNYKFSTLSNVMNDKYFTVELWHKEYQNSGTTDPAIFGITAGLASNQFAIRYTSDQSGVTNPGTYSVYFKGGGTGATGYTLRNANKSTGNEWHHIVFTCSPSQLVLYVDGTQVATQANPVFASDFNLDTATRTRNIGEEGYMFVDEVAIYGQTLTSQQVYDNYDAAFNSLNLADVSIASALAVDPAISTSQVLAATPLTASAASGDHYNSTRDSFTLLDGYMGTLSLEQWYKFDDVKNIINYGSGGAAGYVFYGNSTSNDHGGIQGSGSLQFCGTTADGDVSILLDDYTTLSPELTDYNFSIGFWIKASSAIESYNPSVYNFGNYVGNYMGFILHNSGKLEFQAYSNQPHYIQTASSICDNNWHLVVGKYDGSTMSLYVDNTLIGTASVNSNQLGDPWTYAGFGNNNETATNTPLYLSNFFISSHSAITTTVMGNMMTYATPKSLQAYSNMEMPKFSSNNSFNNITETRGALVDLRFNESSGSPVNYGTTSGIILSLTGDAVTYNQLSPNTKAFKINSTNTKISTVANFPSGTFSTNNDQTLMVYAKVDSGSEPAVINIFATAGHFGGPFGSGLGLFMLGSGQIRARLRDGAGSNTINSAGTYADSKYHLYTATTDGSTVKLYIDGILEGSTSTDKTLTDSSLLMIGGEGDTFGLWDESKSTYIDEVSVYNSAFSAEQVFNHFQALSWPMDWTATAALPAPAVSAGYGPTIAANAMLATAQEGAVFPFIVPLTGQALFQQPNFEATDTVNITPDVMTASAQAENPGWNIGEINAVIHMDATATFPQPQLLIPGFWFDNPKIATADIIQPTVVTTLGALIKPQSLNANAFFVLPPAYYLVADDLWYSALLNVDYQNEDYEGKITFFNTSSDIYLSGGYEDWNAFNNRSPLRANYGYNLYDSPLPIARAGYYDSVNRKAINIRNIALVYDDNQSYSQGWTMETMIQTTKKNQFIAAGKYLGSASSSVSRTKRTGIRLKDGKIAITNVKDKTEGFFTSQDSLAFTGFKDIADGNWHHIIIQYRDDDGRTQIWIDGKLDIQRYGNVVYYPGQIGYNSNDVDVYSDFNISAISVNKESFVLEREIYINYLAAFGINPIKATPATANVTFGTETKGKGNRARALMLYFWPTFNAESGYYVGEWYDPLGRVGVHSSNGHDVGSEPFDYDTFYGLTTYLTDKTQTFFDWDVFPLPVKNFYSGDTYRGDKHPLLNESVMIDTGVNGTTYIDPVTDNYRYVNLMEDVYDLDQYDAIFFRNYPDQSKEQDAMGLNSKTEVDEYFNLQEKTLFAEFLDNLRTAIDTYNISLFVTNPQLAKDLGIIANATPVPLLRNEGSFYADEWSDNRAPVVTGRVLPDGTPKDGVNIYGAGWYDTWFNDRHRVINQLEYLTDDNTFIWTDYAFYSNSDELEYGGPDRLYKRYENRPYGLQIDDEFVFADSGGPRFRLPYQAVKPEDVLAGIPITALSKKIWNQNYGSYVQVDNPYKDYVTTIALPPGTNLKGKLTTGKIFVSFSENVGNSFTAANTQSSTSFVEYHQYDMASNYWVDIAYNGGIIDAATRAQYKAGTNPFQPPLYDDNDSIKQYWSLSGDNIVSRVVPVTQNLKGFVGGDVASLLIENPARKRTRTGLNSNLNSTRLRDALGRFASGGGASSVNGGNLQTFKIELGRVYDTGTVFCPSINTRALWWLSDKVRLTGTVVGGPAAKATATMPQPLVEADHPNTVIAGAMIASATINETQFKSASRNNISLPMTASATIVGLGGKNILAGTGANATAGIVSAYAITQGPEQVIMYLHHVDPILYLRKEIIR